MNIKEDLVKSTHRTAFLSGENDISKWTSAEVRNSENDCLFNVFVKPNQVKICKDQELKQSEPKASPQNQNGKYLILQIVRIQRETYGQSTIKENTKINRNLGSFNKSLYKKTDVTRQWG